MNSSADSFEITATRRPSSCIRRLVRNGAAVYEKQYVADDWGGTDEVVRARANREVQLIELMSKSGQFAGGLGLVRIESCDPKEARIATYEVPGATIEECLHDRACLPDDKLVDVMELAGKWIAKFQTLPLSAEDSLHFCDRDPRSLRHYCEIRLDSLQNYGYSWPQRAVRDRILRAVETLERDASSDELEEVWVHADYSPSNILCDETSVTPIDFAMAHAGRRLDDVTYFLHRLEMQSIYRPWRNWPLGKWQESFLSGFGRPDAPASPMYKALMIKQLVCRLHTYVRRPAKSYKQSLHDRWVRTVLRRRLASLE